VTATSAQRWTASAKSRCDYARERRAALVLQLATDHHLLAESSVQTDPDGTVRSLRLTHAHCAACSVVYDMTELEIDHINGRNYDARRLSTWRRAARYWKEYAAGVPLRAICRGCNTKDGGYRRWRKSADVGNTATE
jgi:hypothetical protein